MEDALVNYAWFMDGFALFLIAFTKALGNRRSAWAMLGVFLVVVAFGNAVSLLSVGLNPAAQPASLLGLIVFGSLGTRFIGEWLTSGASS